MPFPSSKYREPVVVCTTAVAALALAASPCAADSDALIGIHFWGNANDANPAAMMESPTRGGWDLEIVNTGNHEWNDVDAVGPLYQNFATTYNVTPVTRLGYYWGKTLPAPGSPEYANWPAYIANNVVNPLKNTAHLWQMGNEPNLMGEATNWTNQRITPTEYATLYGNVRAALQSPSVVGTAGAHKLLVAPVSPGGAGGDRWMSGTQWLDETLAAIPASQVDSVALHAYGGGSTAREALQGFRSSLLEQLRVIDARGLNHVPLYLTEWNRQTPILPNDPDAMAANEAVTAEFARRALKFVDRWNRTPGNHNVVSTNWFVYDGGTGTGTWDSYSIEYYRTKGPAGNGDLYTAFQQAAQQGYKAGVAGTRPLPAGVSFIDDFETTTGTFAGASADTNANGGSGTTTGTHASSFKVRQNDADSYTQHYADKIGIVDDTTNANGWSVRYVAGGGSPTHPSKTPINLTAGTDGSIGFFLRVYSANGDEDLGDAGTLTTQIVLDTGSAGGGADSDAGAPRTIIADGEWHLYEWSLDDAADWVPWAPSGGDGKLGTNGNMTTGFITVDSIMFHGGNVSVELLLDSVMRNANGSLSVMSVPEPAGIASLALLGGLGLLGRRRGRV